MSKAGLILGLAAIAWCSAQSVDGQESDPPGEGSGSVSVGPDAFGYVAFDNASGCFTNFVSIQATGTNQNLADNSFTGALNLGFTFSFYGIDYTSAFAGSNGYLTLGSGFSNPSNACPLPNAIPPNNVIAGIWDDLVPAGANNVYTQAFASGTCPGGRSGACWIAEWSNVPYASGGGSVTFQIILRDSGLIEVQVNSASQGGSSSTTGIENATASIALTYACNTANSLSVPSAVCFAVPANTPAAAPAMQGRLLFALVAVLAGVGLIQLWRSSGA